MDENVMEAFNVNWRMRHFSDSARIKRNKISFSCYFTVQTSSFAV